MLRYSYKNKRDKKYKGKRKKQTDRSETGGTFHWDRYISSINMKVVISSNSTKKKSLSKYVKEEKNTESKIGYRIQSET